MPDWKRFRSGICSVLEQGVYIHQSYGRMIDSVGKWDHIILAPLLFHMHRLNTGVDKLGIGCATQTTCGF